jgi:sulfite exporter TauE/SafE
VAAINGLALGLASTLHCAGMCGAISSSLSLCKPLAPRQRAGTTFLMIHAGRITAYALAGVLVGTAGAPAIAWLDREIAFRILQWAGAIALMWIGLATAGLMPSFALLDRYMFAISDRAARLPSVFGNRAPQPFFAGLAWGLMPCAMVYGALFAAMLSGSAAAGGVVMLAFGAGTLPGLFATTFGIRALREYSDRRIGREFAGLAIALLGFLSVFILHPSARTRCLGSANSSPSSVAEISPGKDR